MPAPLPLKEIHHVELLVGNAKQAAFYYRKAFGFSQIAYAGPETGVRDQASYVLYQGNIRLVVSTPMFPTDPISVRDGFGARSFASTVATRIALGVPEVRARGASGSS